MHLVTTAPAAATPTDGVAGWVVSVMETLGEPGAGLLVALENLFPPLPSEIILPLAGFSASIGTLNLVSAVFWTTLGSLVGAWALYGLGAWLGRERLHRIVDRMPFVDLGDMIKAEEWFVRHGHASIFLGRLVPVVRSLISIPAGIERMPLLMFSIFTVVGSGLWNSALILAGYALGENWPVVEQYVGYFQYLVIAVVVALVVWYVVTRVRRRRAGAADGSERVGER